MHINHSLPCFRPEGDEQAVEEEEEEETFEPVDRRELRKFIIMILIQ